MTEDQFADRKRLTFEQAEGAEPLPTQLKLKELSPQLRSLLWRVVYDSLWECRFFEDYAKHAHLEQPWSHMLRDMHTDRYHRMADDFENHFDKRKDEIRQIFEKGDYLAVFGWLQWVLRRRNIPYGFSQSIDAALRRSNAAYRVLDDNTLVPVGSDAELETIKRAFADLAASEFHGARLVR